MPDVELKKIQPNRLNPRLEFSKAGLDELSDSIRQVGLLEPIIVRPRDANTYEVVVGERRYRAAQQAGVNMVPVIIRDCSDAEVMELNLIENIQREDLSAVEKGKICKLLLSKFPDKFPTQRSLATKLGVDRSAVTLWLETTRLPNEIQDLIAPQTRRRLVPQGKIDYRTATEISRRINQPDKAVEVVKQIAERPVSQRQAREIAKAAIKEPEKPVKQIFQEVVEEAPVFLPFSKTHADVIVKGIKTQTSRKTKGPRLQPGVIVRAQVTHFADLQIADVYRKKLGDFDDEDAKREGGYTLEEFKEVWKELHGEWNPNESVYVMRFKLVRQV